MGSRRVRAEGLAGALLGGLCALTFGCSEGDSGRAAPGAPIVPVDTPKSDDEEPKLPECDGVTEAGTCQGSAAVFCDADRGALSRTDCAATGKSCVVDARRGATCADLPDSIPTSGTCEDEVAFWDEDGILRRWDCGAEDFACEVDACSDGASCCNADGSLPDPHCCDGADPDCDDPCPHDDPDDPLPEDIDCADIGQQGTCVDEETLVYCVGDSPVSQGCHGGETCQVDACSEGIADCCPDDGGGSGTAEECEELGVEGTCNGNELRYCDIGTDEVVEFECMGSCNPDCGAGIGACCENEPVWTCDTVNGADGICDGNTLYYCLGDELYEQDCGTNTCELDTCFAGGAGCC